MQSARHVSVILGRHEMLRAVNVRPLLHACVVAAAVRAAAAWCGPASGGPGGALAATTALPLTVDSAALRGTMSGRVEATLDFPFDLVARQLTVAAAWCGFLSLHLNTKACVHYTRDGSDYIRLYSGRKHFEMPSAAMAVTYRFAPERAPDRLRVALRAARGPLGTRDYLLHVRAAPAGAGRTSLDLRFRYQLSRRARLGIEAYLHTGGRDKVGFTVLAHGADGHPVYVGGTRGMIERNVVRIYLAVVAYLESRRLPVAQRSRWAQERWYALSERYPRQLRELSRADYLDNKRRELAAQHALQASFERARPGVHR